MRADFPQAHAGAHGPWRVLPDMADFLINGILDCFRESHPVGLDENVHGLSPWLIAERT